LGFEGVEKNAGSHKGYRMKQNFLKVLGTIVIGVIIGVLTFEYQNYRQQKAEDAKGPVKTAPEARVVKSSVKSIKTEERIKTEEKKTSLMEDTSSFLEVIKSALEVGEDIKEKF
jgi:hypothetical protein